MHIHIHFCYFDVRRRKYNAMRRRNPYRCRKRTNTLLVLPFDCVPVGRKRTMYFSLMWSSFGTITSSKHKESKINTHNHTPDSFHKHAHKFTNAQCFGTTCAP
eukprot:m.110142 g.110142  ORF g.110142 m.110142 type:complete len:103 (-) comp12741_c4_seq17:1177-1485(-)